MTKFISGKAVDLGTLGKSAVIMGLGGVQNIEYPRFIDWMKQVNLRPQYDSTKYYHEDHPDLLGPNGLPATLAGSDTSYVVYVRENWDETADTTPIPLKLFATGCTISTIAGFSNVDTSNPNEILLSYAPTVANSGIASFIVTPTAPDHSLALIEVEHLTAWEGGAVFRPGPADNLLPFAGLRAMVWDGVNDTTRTQVSEMSKKDDVVWHWNVPLEVTCELCVRNDQFGWFCIPHLFDDTQVGLWVDELLAHYPTDRPVIVEWSNELWNTGFDQGDWALGHAGDQIVSQAILEWGDAAKNGGSAYVATNKACMSWCGKRSTEVMQVVRARFEAAGRIDQLRTALGVWTAVPDRAFWTINATLWQELDPANYVAPGTVHDFVAVTGYFGDPKYVFQTHGQELLDDMAANGIPSTVDLMNAYTAEYFPTLQSHLTSIYNHATSAGMRMIMYEGGNHVDLGGQRFNKAISPFWHSTVWTSGTGTDFTVGETVSITYNAVTLQLKVVSTAADRIVVNGAPSINNGATIVGGSSGANQTVAGWGNMVAAPGVNDLLKAFYWSQAMADNLAAAMDIFWAAGGLFWNQFADLGRFSTGGNWGTQRSLDHVTPLRAAVLERQTANPRRFFI